MRNSSMGLYEERWQPKTVGITEHQQTRNQRRRVPRATMLQNRLRASISSPEESNCFLANLRETPSK